MESTEAEDHKCHWHCNPQSWRRECSSTQCTSQKAKCRCNFCSLQHKNILTATSTSKRSRTEQKWSSTEPTGQWCRRRRLKTWLVANDTSSIRNYDGVESARTSNHSAGWELKAARKTAVDAVPTLWHAARHAAQHCARQVVSLRREVWNVRVIRSSAVTTIWEVPCALRIWRRSFRERFAIIIASEKKDSQEAEPDRMLSLQCRCSATELQSVLHRAE